MVTRINSLVVCVNYDDFLHITLPRNKRHFDRTLVVTTVADAATQHIAWDEGVECFATDCFFEDGAKFNKGLAIEKALDVLGREGWMCVWDADTVMPDNIEHSYRQDALYCPFRRSLKDPMTFGDELDWSESPKGPMAHEFPGYFHLFHASTAGESPWYSTDWDHAGGYDSDFQHKFNGRLLRPPFEVLHLGSTVDNQMEDLPSRVGENWCGRVTPRLDTGEPPEGHRGRTNDVKQIVHGRRENGNDTVGEKVKQEIPKIMSFFWTGSMSWLRWLSLQSFMRWNPGWDVRLYMPEVEPIRRNWEMDTDDDNLYQGPDYREKIPQGVNIQSCTPPGPMASAQMCDWFQWWILGEDGGFFSDMDIVWTKGLNPLREQYKNADAAFCLENGVMAIGFMASQPRCQLFRDLSSSLVVEDNEDYQHYGTEFFYRFAGIRKVIPNAAPGVQAIANLIRCYKGKRNKKPLKLSIMPDAVVYPFDWSKVDAIWSEDLPVDPESFGIHWFGGNKLSRHWSHQLNGSNWKEHPSTMTNYIRSAIG